LYILYIYFKYILYILYTFGDLYMPNIKKESCFTFAYYR